MSLRWISDWLSATPWRVYLLYASTIFLSAFLLFQIQPIVGKHMLPWFGGSSSVWATSLSFFTGMLFVGYLYAYLLGRYDDRSQARIHLYVVAAAAIAIVIAPIFWHSFYPSLDWTVGNSLSPWANLLFSLLISIGIPYFLLSTTGPLMQYWYGTSENREPYKLYALSNIASFLALGSYPFLIEPHFRLVHQEAVWTVLFLVYVVLAAVVCNHFFSSSKRSRSGEVESEENPAKPWRSRVEGSISWPTRTLWVGLAALPALMLVATTTQITQVIAPIPLLWLLPLCIYLITFILAFWGRGRGVSTWILLLISAVAAYSFIDSSYYETAWRVISDLALLFFLGLYCHGQLYSMRPETRHSAFFYLMLSLGGVIGTCLASLVAPLVFSDLYEFPIAILLAMLLALIAIPESITKRIHLVYLNVARVLLMFAVAAAAVNYINTDEDYSVLVQYRNFYGTVRVYDTDVYRSLMHGGTLHGMQFKDPDIQFTPSTYYTSGSGVARAIIDKYIENLDRTMNIGVIGLGTGAISAYCGSGDTYVFYEIDPQIVDIAQTYFTYLSRCTELEVRVGDARIVLENERRNGVKNGYDVIAVDAFNDDTIPVHLITKEALQLYVDHLRDDKSIIAVHTSNRYLELAPVVVASANELGLTSIVVYSSGEDSEIASAAEWVLLSPSADTFKTDTFAELYIENVEGGVSWTDDYTDIVSAVSIPLDFSTFATDRVDEWRTRLAAWVMPDYEEPEEEYVEEVVEEVPEE